MSADWPVTLRGVTESLVTTLGPNDRWNVAALGLQAPTDENPIVGRTWGRTRTRRNFTERGQAVVQFTTDPMLFVEATHSITEREEPVLAAAHAAVEIDVERRRSGREGGTEWVDWALSPVDVTVFDREVPTTNRGYNAVVEATVAASRLDVASYDTAMLLDRLRYFESVVERCGGPAEREAFARLDELVDADW